MTEIEALSQVEEFHLKFKVPVEESPVVPDSNICKLRINLIQEELNELKQAFEEQDIVEVADALMDLQYVVSGTILACGLQRYAPDLFDEVHRSNMTKLCKSLEEAKDTIKYYDSQRHIKCYFTEENGEYLVQKSTDSKVMKSINYSSPDLLSILEESNY